MLLILVALDGCQLCAAMGSCHVVAASANCPVGILTRPCTWLLADRALSFCHGCHIGLLACHLLDFIHYSWSSRYIFLVWEGCMPWPIFSFLVALFACSYGPRVYPLKKQKNMWLMMGNSAFQYTILEIFEYLPGTSLSILSMEIFEYI